MEEFARIQDHPIVMVVSLSASVATLITFGLSGGDPCGDGVGEGGDRYMKDWKKWVSGRDQKLSGVRTLVRHM
jgi:hypothetical protein